MRRPFARRSLSIAIAAAAALILTASGARAQGTAADYARAAALDKHYEGLATDLMDPPQWIEGTHRLFYRKTVKGGYEFELVDADTRTRRPAFDHARLAATLSVSLDTAVTAVTLPFSRFVFVDGQQGIEFYRAGHTWRCSLDDYSCRDTGPARFGRGGRGRGRGPAPYVSPWVSDDAGLAAADSTPNEGPWPTEWDAEEHAAALQAPTIRESPTAKRAPDGKSEAYIWNYNVYVRPVGASSGTELSYDGSEGNYYSFASIAWSPDSKHLVAYRVVPGYMRYVHYVVSTPPDRLQPRDSVRFYRKPGDVLDTRRPVLFNLATQPADSGGRRALSQRLRASPAPSGGRTAGRSPSSTTSADTRSTA